jgi:iron(III) transport system ATP-binding protein
MTALENKHLVKTFDDNRFPAVDDISFSMQHGEILTLVGPSGCGKTTTLRLIAGLAQPDSGEVWINDRQVSGPRTFIPPEQRDVGMVFQDLALFPHLNAYRNIAFGLQRHTRDQVEKTVREMLCLVGLESYGNRFPHELSGGERQRVALARALAPRPVLVLMDEPFSSLDTDRRISMREQVRSLLKHLKATVIFVTHDQEEALYMGDRVAVFNQGRLAQLGTPEEIFQHSATRFVAEFMGSSIFLPGTVTPEGIRTAAGLIQQQAGFPPNTPVDVTVRADDIHFQPDQAGNGLITKRIFKGVLNLYRLRLDSGETLEAFKAHTEVFEPGTRVCVQIEPGHELCVFARE